MRASHVGGLVCCVVMLGAGALSQRADSGCERVAWYAVALLGFVGIIASQYLKGWLGSSYREMEDEIARLERLMAHWQHSDGSPVPVERRGEILSRHQRLIEKIQFHPDNPRTH